MTFVTLAILALLGDDEDVDGNDDDSSSPLAELFSFTSFFLFLFFFSLSPPKIQNALSVVVGDDVVRCSSRR
jgi:hypothetical protein